MSDLIERPLSFFPSDGPSPGASKAGFRFGEKGTHSSRTMMLAELQLALAATPADAKRADYASAIIDGNCLAKPTSSTRRLTNQRLGELYGLDLSVAVFRAFRRLWELEQNGRPLLALLIAIARDPLLAATAPSIIFLPSGSGFHRDAMKGALQELVGGRLNESTLDKVCRNAASTWAQAGHLAGRTFKKRRPIHPTAAAVALAIYLAHAAGFRGTEIFSCAWLRVLDCDASRARQFALDAKRLGLLDLRMAGDVVELNLSRLNSNFEKA